MDVLSPFYFFYKANLFRDTAVKNALETVNKSPYLSASGFALDRYTV